MRGVQITLLVGLLGWWPVAAVCAQTLTDAEQTMLEALWQTGIDPDQLGERYDPSWVVEDVQRQLLMRWAAGDESAVADVSQFRQAVLEAMLGEPVTPWLVEKKYAGSSGRGRPSTSASAEALPGAPCLMRATDLTVKEMAEVDTASIFTLTAFFRSAYAAQMQRPRRTWLADLSKSSFYQWTEWLITLADPHSKAAGTFGVRPEAVGEAVLQWLLMADLLERMKIFQAADEARSLYHRVLEMRSDHHLALYRAGFLDERYGDYPRSARSFRRLLDLSPVDQEVRLRLGVNLGRIGSMDLAARTLRQVVDSDGAEWMRVVAFQELARVQAVEETATARSTLQEAIDRLPDAWQLRVQLAGLQADRWSAASELVGQVVEGWTADAGESERTRYERARDDELLAIRRQYLEALALHRDALLSAFRELDSRRQGDGAYFQRRQRFHDCEGAISENVVERLADDPPPARMP